MFTSPVRLAFAAGSVLLLVPASLSAGQAFMRAAAETNVNQRYVIESVTVAGVQLDQWEDGRFTPELRARISSLVGTRCDMALLGTLGEQLRKELHLRTVREHLSRGTSPESIRVNFEVVRKDVSFDLSVPKFLYHSKQGWTGEVDASTRVKSNVFSVGVLSNGDDLTERFAGTTVRYENLDLGTKRVRFAMGLEDYHEQWNGATRRAVAGTDMDLYRSRRNLAPEITFVVAKPLTVSVGASMERLGLEDSAASARQANATTAAVHYGYKFETGTGSFLPSGAPLEQVIDAQYRLRLASGSFGSDYAYTRHLFLLSYSAKAGRQKLSSEFTGGTISGNAPLFERFVLGSSSTLRGWNRYEIDALGGNRVAHNSLTYGYKVGEGTCEVFYDTGALWQSGDPAKLRHSVGVGYRQGIFVLTMALPIRDGRLLPVFMVGMNY